VPRFVLAHTGVIDAGMRLALEHDVCQESRNIDVSLRKTPHVAGTAFAHIGAAYNHKRTAMINTLLQGAMAGCIATAPMTLVMTVLHSLLPRREQYPLPPSEIVEQITESIHVEQHIDPEQHVVVTLVGHFGYGAAVGAGYAMVRKQLPFGKIANGIVYGLLVWTVSYLGLLPAAGLLTPATEHPARRNGVMIAAHVVWGAATAWVFALLQAATWRR
jgi:putative membrane protein